LKLRALLAAGAALLCLLVFNLWKSGAPDKTRPGERVVLATSSIVLSSLIFVADTENYFKREGLAVTIVAVPTGKDALDMALHGRADFAAVGSPPLTHAILDGNQLGIIASIAKSDHAFVIVADTLSGIRQATDLRGKKVAARYGTAFESYLDAILIDAGVPPSAVVKVDMNPAEGLAAMKARKVDATVQASPFTERTLQAQNISAVLLPSTFYTAHWNIAASGDTLSSRPGTAQKLLRALICAESFSKQNPERALDDIARWMHVRREDLAEPWRNDVFRVQFPQSLIVGMEQETRWINAGRNSRSPTIPTPNFLDYLDVEPLSKVKPEAIRITR
jgi:ABC-type nitrate/sulfonate/bicarbonate transport system substrate-binding protein